MKEGQVEMVAVASVVQVVLSKVEKEAEQLPIAELWWERIDSLHSYILKCK